MTTYYKLASQTSSKKSRAAELASRSTYQGSAGSATGTPTIKQQTEAERQARMLITSTGERAKGIDRTQQALAALQKQGSVLSGSTAFSKTSGMLSAVSSGKQLTQAQQKAAIQNLVSTSSTNTPNATKRELENTRAILGTGYQSPKTLSVFQNQAELQAMEKALEQDSVYRAKRINNRADKLSGLKNSLDHVESKLKSYDTYISNGQFTGTKEQYTQYQRAYSNYQSIYNKYSSTVQIQNEDIKTYNKNAQNINSKKSFKTIRAAGKAALAKYTTAQKAISKKLPTAKQAEPYIRSALQNARVAGLVTPYQVTSITDKVLKRNDTEKIIQFNLGAYESVQKQPLKAAANLALFFVGGVAIKGLSSAVKALGAGAKTAKIAKLIETTAVSVYVAQSGARYMTVQDARQAGFVTGDIIFNELLPAGLGLKYGIKVVNKLPNNVRLELYVAKTKAKVQARKVTTPTKRITDNAIKSLVNEKNALKREKFLRDFQTLNEREMGKIVREYYLKDGEVPTWTREDWAKIISKKGRKNTLSNWSRFLSDERAKVELKLKQESKIKFTQSEFDRLMNYKPTRAKKFTKTASLNEQIYKRSEMSKLDVGKKRSLINNVRNELIKNPARTPRLIISSLNATSKNTYKELMPFEKLGLVKAIAYYVQPATKIIPTSDTVNKLSSVLKTQPATKTPAATKKTSKKRIPVSPKVTEEPTLKIIPKLKTISTSKKKKKTTSKKTRKTSKQTNVNAVATFKDLLK